MFLNHYAQKVFIACILLLSCYAMNAMDDSSNDSPVAIGAKPLSETFISDIKEANGNDTRIREAEIENYLHEISSVLLDANLENLKDKRSHFANVIKAQSELFKSKYLRDILLACQLNYCINITTMKLYYDANLNKDKTSKNILLELFDENSRIISNDLLARMNFKDELIAKGIANITLHDLEECYIADDINLYYISAFHRLYIYDNYAPRKYAYFLTLLRFKLCHDLKAVIDAVRDENYINFNKSEFGEILKQKLSNTSEENVRYYRNSFYMTACLPGTLDTVSGPKRDEYFKESILCSLKYFVRPNGFILLSLSVSGATEGIGAFYYSARKITEP